MRNGTSLFFGLALAAAFGGAAHAAPTPFTWTPAAIGLTGGTISNANNFNVADFAVINAANGAGSFSENGVLTVLNFLNSGNTVASTGLGSTYSLYVVFNATGTSSGIPTLGSGQSTSGTFSSLTYTIYANPGPTPTVTVSGASPTISGNAGAFAIATGSLVAGTETLTAPTTAGGQAPGYSPTADLTLSFAAVPGEAAFFTAPPPSTIQFLIGNFSATTSVTTLTSGATSSVIDIVGGGGNVTVVAGTAVPEPASLLVLGTGMLGLGLARRSRKRAA